ncbi:MAG: hypothetical protein J1E16_02105 [Muribaculaceae bacterium]|nr:hypothetical protein [Muribaculaceae bacterium]
MKKYILLLLSVFIGLPLVAQVKVSILGDSYSTFEGCIPEGNEPWYGENIGNDVKNVEDTWWRQLIDDNGLTLELNNSWSGATICNTGYRGEDYTNRSFLTRSKNLGDNPDLIFVFGGTNDSWAGSPLGDKDGNDMYTVRPATKAMFQNIKSTYPDALCVAIINTELNGDVENAIVEACELENIPYVKLDSIDKQFGHPSINGMKQISKQVWKTTAPLLYSHLRKSTKE